MELLDVLARLGVAELNTLAGSTLAELLALLDVSNITSGNLAKIVLRQVGADGLLSSGLSRSLILEALPKSDADRLVDLLHLPPSNEPWTELCSRNYRRGGNEAAILYSFLGQYEDTSEQNVAFPQVECIAKYPLFDHQISASRRVTDVLKLGHRPRILLHMPTGSGKTRTAMNVVADWLRSATVVSGAVLWLAHSEELCEQAAEEFLDAWSFLGNRPLTVARFFGANSSRIALSDITDGFVVGGLQLLHSRSRSEQGEFLQFANRVGLVVMDEAHMAMAPSYQHLLRMLAADPRTGILGLSATPGRSTLDASQDVALAEFFNRKKVALKVPGYDNPVEFLQAEGYIAKIEFDRVPYSPSVEFNLSAAEAAVIQEGFDLPYEVIRRLGADVQRNFLILNRIIQEAHSGAKMLVFGCSVDHAKLLANLLIAQGLKAAVVTSETRPDRRRQIIREYRDTDDIQILTNYGVLTTGFDAPRTSVAVITRPTNSVVLYSQMVGRAARGVRAGGNSTCRVITVVDAIPGFRSMAEAFSYWDDIWE
jgi:DNA repair protein RadD